MSDPFDRLLKRCIRTFSLETVYISGGTETPVKGIFDSEYQPVAMDGETVVNSKELKISYHVADLPHYPKRGDQVRIKGVLYNVTEPQPDSEYGVTLPLKLAE